MKLNVVVNVVCGVLWLVCNVVKLNKVNEKEKDEKFRIMFLFYENEFNLDVFGVWCF